MKKDRFLIMALTVILYLCLAVTSTFAAPKPRHHHHRLHREVRKIQVQSTKKKAAKLSTKYHRNQRHREPRRAWAPPIHKKDRRHSLRHQRQGHWEMRKVWVPPTPNYKKVMIPGSYNRWGRAIIGHWIRIADRPGYWAKTWVWVTTGYPGRY